MLSEIFNSILFGSLRPWDKDLADDQFFSNTLKQAPALTIGKVQSLHTRIKSLLKNFPKLAVFPDNYLKNDQNLSIGVLYDLILPAHFNSTSLFYSDLMQAESLRYINNLDAGVALCPADIDIRHLVNSALKHLRYIAVNATKELNSRNLATIPVYKPATHISVDEILNRNTHYVIYLLKLHSIKLIFEIQELYGIHVKNPESFTGFFINVLKENVPDISFLRQSNFYFANKINSFLSSGTDDYNQAIALLDDIKFQFIESGSYSSSAITALENYIFIKQFNIFIESFEFTVLANSANSATFFESVKGSVTELINQKSSGHERYAIITGYLEKLIFIQEISIPRQQQSATRMLYQGLSVLAEAYKNNLSNLFAVGAPDDDHVAKKIKPYPVKDKTSVESLKNSAYEFLKHFSGYNVHKEKIMIEKDYHRLLEYTYYMIEHEKLPSDIKPIPQLRLSANHIRYTYYLIHQSLYGTKEIKPVWIDFLQKVFTQFAAQEWSTIKIKFSQKPTKYDHDLKIMNPA